MEEKKKFSLQILAEALTVYASAVDVPQDIWDAAKDIGYDGVLKLRFDTRHQVDALAVDQKKKIEEVWTIYADRMVELTNETVQPIFVQALLLHYAAEAFDVLRASMPHMRTAMNQRALDLLLTAPQVERVDDWDYVRNVVYGCLFG